ncbi:MAG: right-handed parallel beta-helix repeat-containing protein, partial [Phycisphaerales bacterium]
CPTDPNKIAPGTCGCGVADTDTDSDGVVDCEDNCPLIANPTQSDCDGDGIGDACEVDCNDNGVPDDCDLINGTSLDTNSNGKPDECELNVPGDFADLQDAINAAQDGWLIQIGEGVTEGTYTIEGVSVTIVGSEDPADTVLDGSGGTVFVVVGTTGQPTVIRGFTILGGGSGLAGGLGPAIELVDSNAVIEDCIISGAADGGVSITGGSPTIRNTVVSGNASEGGGAGIRLVSSSASLDGVVCRGNLAAGAGGGLLAEGGEVVISGCTFESNAAAIGGGLSWSGSGSITILDSLFADNSAGSGSALHAEVGAGEALLDAVAYCGVSESAIVGPWIEAGPVVGEATCRDCDASGEIDVLEIALGVLEDVNADGIPDICEGCIADINGDGIVDGEDLGILLIEWGSEATSGDLDLDGLVGGEDLAVLLEAWGPCGG